MHVLVTCKYKKDRIKSIKTEERCRNHFPIISYLGLSVDMETRVLIITTLKVYAAFPHSDDATYKK